MQWEHVAAATIAVLVQAGLAWLLARAMAPPLATTGVAESVLDVVWLPRARPASPPSPTTARPDTPRGTATGDRRAARTPSPMQATPSEATAPATPRPMAAVYLMQARQQAQAGTTAGTLDPLSDRHARLPGEGAQRFRMRPPPGGVAAVVSKVGRLFGAEDADAPCRETRRNIGDLALDGDSAALQQQIDRERRLCRP